MTAAPDPSTVTDAHPDRPVVVGCDGSWESYRAVEVAAREADRRGAPLAVLAVPAPGDLYADSIEEAVRREQDALERSRAVTSRAVARVQEVLPRIEVHAHVTLEGSPVLDDLAHRAALLVLGRRGRGGQTTFSLGSASAMLVHRFEVPVLLAAPTPAVGGEPHRHPQVVVGLRGGPDDTHTVAVAVEEAHRRGWPLWAVHVLFGRGTDEHDDAVLEADHETWQAVGGFSHVSGTPVRTETVRGDVALVMAVRSAPGDLLVLGNRGRGHVTGLVPGCLTLRVVSAATCDVLLVPQAVSRRAPADRLVGARSPRP